MPEEEKQEEKAAREQQELMIRCQVAKATSELHFNKMVSAEKWDEDKVTLLKARASELFKLGFLEMAAAAYTRVIGIHACSGKPAPHALYSNRSACRCGFGDYDGALSDAEECVSLSPTWAKGYVRVGAALHRLYRLDEAVRAYELGLTYEPSLTALSDGLSDVLRRRKAAGGHWDVAFAGERSANVQARTAVKTPPHTGHEIVTGVAHLLLAQGPSPLGDASSTEGAGWPPRTVICIDGMDVKLIDTQRGSPILEVPPQREDGGTMTVDSLPLAACCDPTGADRSLYTVGAGSIHYI